MLSTRSPTFKPRAVKNSELDSRAAAHDQAGIKDQGPARPGCDPRIDPALLPQLDDLAVLRLHGPDAESFAQSQFMNDVLALAPGRWHWNGWLSAKGRVQALFALGRPAAGELLLVLLDQPAAPFCESLRRFVLRRRVAIIDEAGFAVHAEFPDGPSSADTDAAARDRLQRDAGGAIGFDVGGDGGGRIAWIAPRAARGGGPVPDDAGARARWRRDDLRHGLPRVATGTGLAFTPHMLSLDRLKAFSVRKGCYPGQEIVARTHFLGQSKRQGWWIEGTGLAAGQPVHALDGREVGSLVEVDAGRRGGLAVAALEAPGPVRCGDGAALATVPLGGLARPV